MPEQAIIVKCPTCKSSVLWSEANSFRPFCCERCKLIDLGEWAAEEKVIPGEPLPLPPESADEAYFQ